MHTNTVATAGQQGELTGPAHPAAQRVQMHRSELERYVVDGRPTGLLLRSVAMLKGIDADAIARSSGIPMQLVESIFNDYGAGSIKKGAIKRVAQVLGIDLSVMRFAAGQVHIFQVDRIKARAGSEEFRQAMRGVGLLARNVRAAELKVGTGIRAFKWRGRMHVVQNDHFRALFVGSGSKKFDLSFVPSADWVCKDRADSTVPIANHELIEGLIARDLTEGEFDELFLGVDALTWDDIRVASRVNGVSKVELMRFIVSRADESDATEDEAEKQAAIQGRPALRLVELPDAEPRYAVGGM
ncbi:hypothetical protein [Paucibacter soli]|uniref:hypothetical protein n=1 Tax=Paucibacter soli TaxID=3133433 RepID=UPI0030953382